MKRETWRSGRAIFFSRDIYKSINGIDALALDTVLLVQAIYRTLLGIVNKHPFCTLLPILPEYGHYR